ncbi:hypothetical protein GGX14DRAFT_569497 [Mycena pura]|uniref:Uncharacterized protein n=1 Tax=Mycena pura TaxID=153505 RepID=A0AAD6YDQ2_9AGAR|nr:hypothetical protein GGX14DRAFT_569497 [Mycena pura]
MLNTPDPSGRPIHVIALCTRHHPSVCLPSPPPPLPSLLTAFWDAHASSSTTPHSARAAALLASHDAQELFSECMHEENARVGSGAGVLNLFDSLTATRGACLHCGYTAAICHFVFDTVQLALESAGGGWAETMVKP